MSDRKILTKLLLDIIDSPVSSLVKDRIRMFEENGKGSIERIFIELCFCILTANYNAERAIKIQDAIDEGFITYDQERLSRELRLLGYRYPNTRARYIVEARKHIHELHRMIHSSEDSKSLREWLARNIKGLGYKEASHFMRNIGYKDIAIIDFHILNIISKYNIARRPRTITTKKYLELEEELSRLAEDIGISLAELDLYLWYLETGKILK
jgi:N-glycosylase/DNA lyase